MKVTYESSVTGERTVNIDKIHFYYRCVTFGNEYKQ